MIKEVLPYADTTLLVLCGGTSRRMQGQDKGLVKIHDKTMVQHVTDNLSSDFSSILISCNRHMEQYADFGFTLLQDRDQDMGPLGGLLAAMTTCNTSYLAIVPCDTPFISKTVYDLLIAAAQHNSKPAFIAHDGNRLQMLHAVFNLRDFNLDQSLQAFMATDKAVKNWYRQIGINEVDCSAHAQEFNNINSAEDLSRL